MDKKVIDVLQFQSDSFDLTKTIKKINLSEVLKSSYSDELKSMKLYVTRFNKIITQFS
jgi:hypothetical protein